MRYIFPYAWCTGGGIGSSGWARAAHQSGSSDPPDRAVSTSLLRTNEMNMGVDSARCDDFSFAGKHFRSSADNHSGCDTAHYIRIACLANACDASVANADVCFINSTVIDDHRIRDHEIEHAISRRSGCRLPHAVMDHFAAAEFGLFAGRESSGLSRSR